MASIKHQVVIAYTQKLCSEGLESMIECSNDFAIRGMVPVNNLAEFLKTKNSFEILLIELRYPNKGDMNLLIQLKKEHPGLRIMLISLRPCIDLSRKLIDIGIDAFILKSCSKSDMFAAMYKILDGNNFFCSEIIKSIVYTNGNSSEMKEISLTQRETEVLSLLVNGKTNLHIAEKLSLSENTVKSHRKNILAKFGATNLIGMIRYACRARLLDYDPSGFCTGCPHFS